MRLIMAIYETENCNGKAEEDVVQGRLWACFPGKIVKPRVPEM